MANIIIGGTYSLPMVNIVYSAFDIVQICKPNPRRVAVGFFSGDVDCRIYPTASGVILSQIKPSVSTNGGIWFLSEDSGPLVQIEWYSTSISSGTITIMQVVQEV